MKNKRKSRILALQGMYALDVRPADSFDEIVREIILSRAYKKEVLDYALILMERACENKDKIDAQLQKHANNWDIKRMSVIDRNILRLAVVELSMHSDVPYRVVMDEAVEIAKIYSTSDSGKFANGVIDAIYKNIMIEEKKRKDSTTDGSTSVASTT